MHPENIRVAWISPLAEAHRLASARTSRLLLPHLESSFELELFVDDSDWLQLLSAPLPTIPVFHIHRFWERYRLKAFDSVVLHVEDDPRARQAQLAAKLIPNLSVFHDVNLFSLYFSSFLHSTAAKDIDELMQTHFGPGTPPLGEYHIRKWSYGAFEYLYPFGSADLQAAAFAGFHSALHQRMALREGRESPCLILQQAAELFSDFELKNQREAFRGHCFDGSADYVIGVCSNAPSAQLPLQEFSTLSQAVNNWRLPNVKFVELRVAGSVRDGVPAYLAENADAYFEIGQIQQLREAAAGVDALIWLGNGYGRGLPPLVQQALASRTALIGPESGVFEELPSAVCLRYPPGLQQTEYIGEIVSTLLERPEVSVQIASAGRQWAEQNLLPSTVAERYAEAIVQTSSALRIQLAGKAQQLYSAKEVLIRDTHKRAAQATRGLLPSSTRSRKSSGESFLQSLAEGV